MGDIVNPGVAPTVLVGQRQVPTDHPPTGYVLREDLGLLVHQSLTGQLIHSNSCGGLFETRATITPRGDYLLMFPDGLPHTTPQYNGHYAGKKEKVNNLLAYRSSDKGRTWPGPTAALDIPYNLHGFIPLIPKGSSRIYCFGTQPLFDRFNGVENAPIGYRWSDDDGHAWSDVSLIEPANDPTYMGMSVMRMAETDAGTWLLGTHTGTRFFQRADGSSTTRTRCYILRSVDRGQTWTIHPKPRPAGWSLPAYDRMDEIRPISLGGGKVAAFIRTCEGHLWQVRSNDDGQTWGEPMPTSLVHPDAPPMVFHLSDGKTLAAFHHNAHTGSHFNRSAMADRGQVWVAFSRDGGLTWDEPRFLLANAHAEATGNAWLDHNCSYLDMFTDGQMVHLFMPHRWCRALHLQMREADLLSLSPGLD